MMEAGWLLVEGRLDRCVHYVCCPGRPPINGSVWKGAEHEETGLQRKRTRSHFQQDNAQHHTARVSQDCIRIVTTLPFPARSPDWSPIGHFWNLLRRLVGHPTGLNELDAR
ncbi:transposable element Tcb2 transposase [Trichonephila clavipes]|nr:transposable element Tcb2 transposase [Trichonephila clavipes]